MSMFSNRSRQIFPSPFVQFVTGFVIPTLVLLTLSGESMLGPAGAMVLALSFPVALEIYGLLKRRKPSTMSLVAIAGILLIGLISFFGLSEQWLAVRRSGIYFFAAIAVIVIVRFRPQLIERTLNRVLNMERALNESRRNGSEARLMRHAVKTCYMLTALLLITGIASYVLTLVFINAPTGSSEFNAQYAELRIMSLAAITLPFLVGMTGLLVSLAHNIEKLTGVTAEQLLRKRR